MAGSIHKHLLTYENVDQHFIEKFLVNSYVDDNINEDILVKQLLSCAQKSVACMKDAGFELRKFDTNDLNLQTAINKIEKL